MSEIVIAGNKYIAKKVTLSALLKASKLEERIQEFLKAGEYEKYAAVYISRAELFVTGSDMKQLSPDILTPTEARELESFFFSLVEPELPKSEKLSETSAGT